MRKALREAPHRLVDCWADMAGRRSTGLAVPPASLRSRVARTSSRRAFLEEGEKSARDLRRFLRSVEAEAPIPQGALLDFGCGCGRIGRHMQAWPFAEYLGTDPDGAAIDWCRENLPGSFSTQSPQPPLELPASSVSLAVCVSIFTHLSEEAQFDWLHELKRILEPGGVLLVSTHSEELVFTRPDLDAEQHLALQKRGFLFAPGGGPFNEGSSFHTPQYLQKSWGEILEFAHFERLGLCGFQDLSAWRKPSCQKVTALAAT